MQIQWEESQMNRREFTATALGAMAARTAAAQDPRKKVAVIATHYTSCVSHAKVIVGKMLEGYSPNGVFTRPRTRVVSMHTDQTPSDDLSRPNAEKFGYKIYPTVKD